MNFAFILDTTSGEGDPLSMLGTFGGIALMILAFYFFIWRPRSKKEKEDAMARDALQVGDEVTTIGGIIGKVISIKEETFVLETTKSKTRIRFHKGAIRTIDVKIADTLLPREEAAPTEKAEEAPAETEGK